MGGQAAFTLFPFFFSSKPAVVDDALNEPNPINRVILDFDLFLRRRRRHRRIGGSGKGIYE